MRSDKLNTSGGSIDWAFLAFLIGSTYVKLYVKIAAIVLYFIYLKSKNYEFKTPNRLTKFYFIIILIGGVSSAIAGSFSAHGYPLGFFFGSLEWFIGGCISYLVYIAAINIPAERYHNALKYFFIVNAAASIIALLYLTIKAGGLPYRLTGPQFGVSTGDYINGISGNTSFANAAISTLGILYFLFRREYTMLTVCTITMLLCTSNVTLGFLLFILALIILFNRESRKPAIMVLLLCTVVYPLLSPQNLKYINVFYERQAGQDKKVGREELPKITRKVIVAPPADAAIIKITEDDGQFRQSNLAGVTKANVMYAHKDAHSKPFIAPTEFHENIDKYRIKLSGRQINVSGELDKVKTLAVNELSKEKYVGLDPYILQNVMARWYDFSPAKSPALTAMPGKVYTGLQTFYFLRSNIKNFLLGGGTGNFSSKLAIKMTGLGIQGSFPAGYNYISADYLQYHFFTLLYYLSQHAAEHSILNTPNSIYNQLAGEYGLIGLLFFLVLYIGYFRRHRRELKNGKYLLLIVLLFFGMEYWFETLSLTVLFEAIAFKEIINNSGDAKQ